MTNEKYFIHHYFYTLLNWKLSKISFENESNFIQRIISLFLSSHKNNRIISYKLRSVFFQRLYDFERSQSEIKRKNIDAMKKYLTTEEEVSYNSRELLHRSVHLIPSLLLFLALSRNSIIAPSCSSIHPRAPRGK